MSLIRAFFPFLSWTVMVMLLQCAAEPLPPPTALSFKWLDPFTVNVSWSWRGPSHLPQGCEVKYEYHIQKDGQTNIKRTNSRHLIDNCLTRETGSHSCTYIIRAMCCTDSQTCNISSSPSNITVGESQDKVVKNFSCLLDKEGLNCSWIPVKPSQNVMLSHRECGYTDQTRNTWRKCSQYYSSRDRRGCYLRVPGDNLIVCVHVKTETAWSTFKAEPLVVRSPKLNITEDQGNLKLTWESLGVGADCLKPEVKYTECNKPMHRSINRNYSHSIPYTESCLYEIWSRVVSSSPCPDISSDWSDVVTYGSNRPPDGTLTVVTIVIPIILFVCVILSCYCFRKHINILCPIIPDPSAIFKEMMMNGNKDQRPGNLYTPVPEPVEPCKITLVTENSILQ